MNLPGRLRSTTLGDLLGTLHRGQASGTLELTEDSGRVHRVTLLRGLIAAVEVDGPVPPLGDFARREKVLDDATLDRGILESLRSQRLLGDVLVDEFAVAPVVVRALLRRQIGQRLRYLEVLADARIRFRVAVRTPKHSFSDPLPVDEFLHGRARARENKVGGEVLAARALLGVGPQALPAEIKTAFKSLVRRLHPDLNAHLPEPERHEVTLRFLRVKDAFRLLTEHE